MKTTISLHQPVQATTFSRFSSWLKTPNSKLTELMGESVTNLQTLLILHAMISGSILISFVVVNPLIAVVLLCWFAYAIQLCKKGGLK